MRAVAIGSSAEHGSSMRITSGFTAMVRAMHSRCCWPPDRLTCPAARRRSFTSSHRPARCRLSCARSRRARRDRRPARGCAAHRRRSRRWISGTDWASGTPCPRGRAAAPRPASCRGCRWPSSTIEPSTRAPSMVSFIRLRQRRNVDLPQPDGPIMASTWLLARCRC